MKTKQQMSYITLTLLKSLNSGGIGPVSRLELKSKTLRFLNEPICFRIVPKSMLRSKYLYMKRGKSEEQDRQLQKGRSRRRRDMMLETAQLGRVGGWV
jgi:hypothetical protein